MKLDLSPGFVVRGRRGARTGPGKFFECVAPGSLPGDVTGLGQALGDAESVTPGLSPGDVVGIHLLGCAFGLAVRCELFQG